MPSDYRHDKAALPEQLHGTYDDVTSWLYGGSIPRRSIRLDMLEACVESFDFIVKLIANSRFCIKDITERNEKMNRKSYCRRNCERCIRSYCYKHMEHERIAALTKKEKLQ